MAVKAPPITVHVNILSYMHKFGIKYVAQINVFSIYLIHNGILSTMKILLSNFPADFSQTIRIFAFNRSAYCNPIGDRIIGDNV